MPVEAAAPPTRPTTSYFTKRASSQMEYISQPYSPQSSSPSFALAHLRRALGCSVNSERSRRAGPRSSCRSKTPFISRGLILSREVNDCIWTPGALTFLDVKTAGFDWQNHRKLHAKSVDASGVRFHSFTSRESIRHRFRKDPNAAKEHPTLPHNAAPYCHWLNPSGDRKGQALHKS